MIHAQSIEGSYISCTAKHALRKTAMTQSQTTSKLCRWVWAST